MSSLIKNRRNSNNREKGDKMQKMILSDGTEFNVTSVYGTSQCITIDFEEGTVLSEVLAKFDKYNNPTFSEDVLRRFELHNEEGLQGIHVGYTDVKSVTTSNGKISVLIEKENELKTDLTYLAQQVADMELFLLESAGGGK